MSTFNETEHPRDKSGRWRDKPRIPAGLQLGIGNIPADIASALSFDHDEQRECGIALAAVAASVPEIRRAVYEHGPKEVVRRAFTSTPIDGLTEEQKWRLRGKIQDFDMGDLLRRTEACGARIVTAGDDGYPARLHDLKGDEPVALWVRGNLPGDDTPATAIVGARASTPYGAAVTSTLATELAERGDTIVSGGAYGIDAAAHRAAINSSGTTVAVMAGGLDRLYPAGNQELLGRVEQTGAIVSEVPPGATPTRDRFLQRNRIVAALSDSLLVVEAGVRSGSINAAWQAHEIGRPVYAVPGPVTSAQSEGTNELIKTGLARMATCADDILPWKERR